MRSQREEGETDDQYNYHLQEKEFISAHLRKVDECPKYDVHKIRYDKEKKEFDGPVGMDPCQTLVQYAYAKIKQQQIEKVYEKDVKRTFIKQGDLSEGVYREDLDCIPVPQPQNYHNYCQICASTYDNYEKHILTDFHLRKSRN